MAQAGRAVGFVLAVALGTALLPSAAEATLCKPDNIYQEDRTEAKRIYDEPFGKGDYRGVHDYNARIIGCNRWRDELGYDIDASRPITQVYDRTLSPRIVKGHIRYFNFAGMRYSYRLERHRGDWIVTVVAEFHFPRKKFPNRLDIPLELAGQLGIRQQFCTETERRGLNIVRGLVEIDDSPDACRIPRETVLRGTPVTEHLMEYWRDAITGFWSRPGDGFEVRVLIENLDEVPADEMREYKSRNAIWHVRLNHNKNSRPMYRASIGRPHPLYAGLDAAVIVHEFGHVLGLDDEYPGSNNPPDYRDCGALGGQEYAMCDMPPSNWESNTDYGKGVYAWIVTRRYAVAEDADVEPWHQPGATRTSALEPDAGSESSASGEYVAPPPTEDLVDEDVRELATADPTEANVNVSPTERQPAVTPEDLANPDAIDTPAERLAVADPTQAEQQTLPTRQRPVAADATLNAAASAGTTAAGDKSPPGAPSAAAGGRLIAHFPLDGSPGNTRGEPGRIYAPDGTPPQTVPGRFGQAYLFGERAVIAAPLDIDFETHQKVTITAWVKLFGEDGDGFVVSSGPASSAPGLRLSNERVRGESAGRKPVLYEGDKIGSDDWRFIGGVWDFENHTLRLYNGPAAETFSNPKLDVAALTSRKRNQPLAAPPDDDEAEPERYVYIGALNFKGQWFAEDVAIDDVRIYAGALDDQAVAAIRNAPPAQVAGRDRIGETEKNLSEPSQTAGTDAAPSISALPEGMKTAPDGLEDSEFLADAAERDRLQDRLLEGGSNNGSDDTAADADPQARSGADQRQTDTGDGSGPETRQQALEPSPAGLVYGDRIYLIGDISGSEGSYAVTKTFYEQQAILSGFGTTERKDKPCGVELKGNRLAGGDTAAFDIDKCGGGGGGAALDQIPTDTISDDSRGIVGLQICGSGLRADKRVKGVRVTTRRIRDDGSLGTNTQTEVLLERANCGSWENHSVCSGQTVATGVKLYFADGTQLAPRDYLTGAALMCSELQPAD